MTSMPPLALLAGGLGTRMRPLSERIPKALLEVAGEPFIAHQLRLIRREGITRVVLCVGHLGEQIEQFASDGKRFDLNITYSPDGPTLLGTGGSLRKALPHLGAEFLVMYGDSWLDTSYAPVVKAFRASGKSALMTVFRNEGRWDRSNVWFANGGIQRYDKREPMPQAQHIDWGLSAMRAEVLRAQPADRPIDLADIFSELARNHDLAGYEVGTRFYEIGSAEGLAEADALLRSRSQSL
ncbi:MAG: N-acetyl-alpha-D-muramate 1-phosphate uridylyltransferase [Alphaproteobacteria bacterium]|nr:N-acetyl-alpha-D-muramate 1-phosphate uridylyltransferase [Alphaproteobacteria bacterium]